MCCRLCVIIVRVLTRVLGLAGFVLLFMYLPQDWVFQALCYCCSCTYHRTGCFRLCVVVHVLTTGLGVSGFVLLFMYLPQDWVLQALCYWCTCTYHRTGCCRFCGIIVHVLTTGLGAADFVLCPCSLLTTGLGVAGSAGTVPVVSVGVTDTAVAPIGWSWIVAESGSCLRAPSTRHTAGTPCVPATPVPVHWHNCKDRHRCSQSEQRRQYTPQRMEGWTLH